MDAPQKANQDMNLLLNVTVVLMQCLRYHQIYTYAGTIFANLMNYSTYMKQVENPHNGLSGCCYNQYIITRYTPSQNTQRYSQAH